jgi:hypothetical protein
MPSPSLSTAPGLSPAESFLANKASGQPNSQPPQTPQPQAPTQSASGASQNNVFSQPIDQGALTLSRAIALQESSKDGRTPNYTATGDAGTSYGAYQWNNGKQALNPGELPVNFVNGAKDAGLDPTDFSPQNQDKVAYAQVMQMKKQGLQPEQIAAAWNAGMGHINDWQTHVGTTMINGQAVHYDTPSYVRNVQSYYQQLAGNQQQQTQQPPPPQQDPNALPTYGATFPASPQDTGLVAGFKALGNLPSSIYGFGAGLVNTATHLPQTAQNLAGSAIGGVENLQGQNQGNPDQYQQTANALGHSLMQRYGSLDALRNTATNDPFGFGTDVVSILAGGAGLIGKGADLGELGSRVAQTALSPITKTGSKLADLTVGGGAIPDVAAASARTGIELPAAAYTNNPIVNAGEALAATGGGEAAYSARVENALSKMQDVSQKVVESAGGTGDLTTAGEKIAQGLKDYETAFNAANDAVFSKIKSSVGDVAAKTDASSAALDSIISNREAIADTTGIKYFKDKLDVINGTEGYKPPTLDTLKQIRTSVGKKIGDAFKDPTADVGQLKQLYGTLTQDIRNTILYQRKPAILRMYDKANEAYKAGYEVISSQYAGKIRRLAEEGQHSKIVDALIKPSTAIEDIPRILKVAGPQGAKEIQSTFLQNIFDGAKDVNGDFTSTGINKMLKKYGEGTPDRDKVSAILSPQQVQQVKDLGTLTDAMKKITALQKGASPSYMVRMALQFKALGEPAALAWAGYNLLTGDVVGALTKLAGVVGAEGASRFLASDVGNSLLKWGALHGTEFSTVAKAEGLTPPPVNDTINANDSGNSTLSGSPSDVNNGIQGGTKTLGTLAKKGAKIAAPAAIPLEELAKQKNFDLQGARNSGYDDATIQNLLKNQ